MGRVKDLVIDEHNNMTGVEVIQAQIVGMAIEDSARIEAVTLTNALITAARVEGGKQEREKWIMGNETEEENDKRAHVLENRLWPVLVPKASEQDNTTEEEYEDMRRNGGPEVKP